MSQGTEIPRTEDGYIQLVRSQSMADTSRPTREVVETLGHDTTNVLAVIYSGAPDDWLSMWQGGPTPADVGVVTAGKNRSAAASASANGTGPLPVRVVDEPGDLTGLGMRISEYLSRWENSPADLVFTFDSLTALLQYADLRRTFRFLHVLTDRLRQHGAVAHFHIDPTAHDDQTFHTIGHLFDDTVDLEDHSHRIG